MFIKLSSEPNLLYNCSNLSAALVKTNLIAINLLPVFVLLKSDQGQTCEADSLNNCSRLAQALDLTIIAIPLFILCYLLACVFNKPASIP